MSEFKGVGLTRVGLTRVDCIQNDSSFPGETPAVGDLRTLFAARTDAVSAVRYFWP